MSRALQVSFNRRKIANPQSSTETWKWIQNSKAARRVHLVMSITLLLFLKFQVINRKWFIQRIALTHGIASYANFLEQKIILRQKEVKS